MTRKGPNAQPDDRIRLMRVLDAAREASRFLVGRTRADLDTDAMFRRALTSCIQDIGEAAFKTSDAGRARAPEIPWAKVIGSRHILVHAYYNIDLDIVWRIAEKYLHDLVTQLEKTLNDWPSPT